MPLPLIPIAIALGASALGALGVKKGVEGVANANAAKERGKRAEAKHRAAVARVDAARETTNNHAVLLGREKKAVLDGTIAAVSALLQKLEKRSAVGAVETLDDVSVTREEFDGFRAKFLELEVAFGAASSAAVAGSAAGGTAVAGVGLFGAASTGTAISGLSGVAATNATLAWLGGGSLAVGGGGMAVGTAVLGGVVVGPALAVTGFVLASQGEKQLTRVVEYEAKVSESCKECDGIAELLAQFNVRIEELRGVIRELDRRTLKALGGINVETWSADNDEDLRQFRELVLLARALGEVLRAPVIDANGKVSEQSANVRTRYRTLLS